MIHTHSGHYILPLDAFDVDKIKRKEYEPNMQHIDLYVEEEKSDKVEQVYEKLEKNISKFRKTLNRPLTLTEKILAGHLEDEFLDNNLDAPPKNSLAASE